MMRKLTIRRQGRTFGVFDVSDGKNELLEGGFFSYSAAEQAREELLFQDIKEAEAKGLTTDGA
jgi:hypothetical protein